MVSLDSPLVSIDWLKSHLFNNELIILDASLKKQSAGDYQIPGTRVFDIDGTFSDGQSPLPHTLPSPKNFETEVRRLGIQRDSLIVIYDRVGIYSSPRARWMFQVMGHERVAILNGGFPAWIKAGFPLEEIAKSSVVSSGNFKVSFKSNRVCGAEEVASALSNKDLAVLDARSEGRFKGEEPEPRSGLRSGHMPGSVNLPFESVLSNGHMKAPSELAKIFATKVRPGQKLIFSCGSGITACIPALAAELIGHFDISVYDGSWSEWGKTLPLPVVKGL